VTLQHRALVDRYGHTNVFISCDFNGRALDLGGTRFTHDTHGTPSRRDELLASLCAELEISPLHGRSASHPAHVTSRSIDASLQLHDEQGREVDYILGSIHLAAERFKVLPVVPFSKSGGITHRCIGVTIFLEPKSDATAVEASAKPARRDGPRRPPDYDSPLYDASNRFILENIRSEGFKETLACGSADDALKALEGILTGAQRTWLPVTDEQAAREALHADPMHHVPTDGRPLKAQRVYGGRRLPPATASIFTASRAKRNRADKLRKRALAAARLGQVDRRKALTIESASLRAEARELNRHARCDARRWQRQWEAGVVRVWEHRRTHSAADLWKQLNKAAPVDPNVADVGSRPPPFTDAQRQAFWRGFESLYVPPADRPPLSGPSDAYWDQFIPRADGSRLGDVLSVDEVYHAIYPPHKDDAPDATRCPSGLASCAICATEATTFDGWDGDVDNTDDAPVQGPSVHTSTAAGQDGLFAEVLRFSRNADPGSRRAERREVCAVLAQLYARWHADGVVPAAACKFRSTPLFKDGDVFNYLDYRFLTVGDLLQKVWCVAMVRRLTHWAVGGGILSDTQAAFIPQHGCEQHVYSLTESIRWNWAKGRDVSALFIDLRKAYDMVRPEALYPLLRKMGVSDLLIRLLESRSRQRVSRLRVDGVEGPEVNMTDGTGQGDPLSCILFNLFMEPLLRSMDKLPGTTGIRVGDGPTGGATPPQPGVSFRVLAFADDLTCPVTSPEELQVLLDHLLRWCDAWGMEVGVKKTQAVHFPRPARRGDAVRQPPQLPQLSVTWRGVNSPIVWAESYRYLGHWLFGDLRVWGRRVGTGKSKLVGGMGFMDEVTRRATLAYRRTVEAHTLIRKAPPALCLQIFRTAVTGCFNFLMALMEPSAKTLGPLDKLSLKVARDALRLKANGPSVLAWAESRLTPTVAILARERSRFLLSLQLSPLSSIAKRVYFAVASHYVPAAKPLRAAPGAMWTHRMLDLQRGYTDGGAQPAAVSAVQLVPAHTVSRLALGQSLLVPAVLVCGGVTALAVTVQTPPPHFVTHVVPEQYLHLDHDARDCWPPAWVPPHGHTALYADIKRAAGVHARSLALLWWRNNAAQAAAKTEAAAAARPDRPLLAPARTSEDRPRPGPPTLSCADLLMLGSSTPVEHAASAGVRKTITPLSVRGPGCSGAIRSLSSRQAPQVNAQRVAALSQGRQALFNYPLAPAPRMPPPRLAPSAAPRRAPSGRHGYFSPLSTDDTDDDIDASSDLEASIATDSPCVTPPAARARSGGGAPSRQPSRACRTSSDAPLVQARVVSPPDNTTGTDSSPSTSSSPAPSPPIARPKGRGKRAEQPSAPRPAVSAAFTAWRRAANDLSASCTLCSASTEDPYHIICECTHPDVVAVRASITSITGAPSLPRKLVQFCKGVLEASSVPGTSAEQQLVMYDAAQSEVARLSEALGMTPDGDPLPGVPALDWSTPELRFVLWRTLNVATFSAAVAAPTHHLVRQLGCIFDYTTAKPHKLRPVANAWCSFAGSSVDRLFGAWNAAFMALRAAGPAGIG